jgi:RNA polymerase sigma-70 factor (ECF subfamily)
MDSTIGAIKSALHRGRGKLKDMSEPIENSAESSEKHSLITRYVDLFNQQDWQGLQNLIRQDARLEVVGSAEIFGRNNIVDKYFGNYKKLAPYLYFTNGYVDGRNVIVCWKHVDGLWQPSTAIEFDIEDGEIVAIKDYIHIEYILEDADITSSKPLPKSGENI